MNMTIRPSTENATPGVLVKGKLRIIGNIDVTEPDGSDSHHYPMAMLITFDDAEQIRKAITDGVCEYEFLP